MIRIVKLQSFCYQGDILSADDDYDLARLLTHAFNQV